MSKFPTNVWMRGITNNIWCAYNGTPIFLCRRSDKLVDKFSRHGSRANEYVSDSAWEEADVLNSEPASQSMAEKLDKLFRQNTRLGERRGSK